jgi:hypothetical protein
MYSSSPGAEWTKISWMSSRPTFSSDIHVFTGAKIIPPSNYVVRAIESEARLTVLHEDDLVLAEMSRLGNSPAP